MNQDIKPFRDVICTDAIEWLKSIPPQGLPKECGVFTSLPDISELPELFHGFLVKEYKEWFTDTADLIMSRLSVGNYIILLQSDVRMMNTQREVYEWIDKSHLTSIAADRNNCTLVWHKLVLSQELNYRSTGRPTYSHLVCYVKNPAIRPPVVIDEGLNAACKEMVSHRTSHFAIPDIFHRGEMLWPKAIGLDCCYAGVMFLKEIAKATILVDPFCGQGTTLAMANALGMNARGVEISTKRCEKSTKLKITSQHLDLIAPSVKTIKLLIVDERSDSKEKKEAAASKTNGDAVDSKEDGGKDGKMQVQSDTGRTDEIEKVSELSTTSPTVVISND